MNISGNSPIKVLSIAFCLTIVILAVISLVVWNSFKDLENIEENKLRVDELAHNITYFDEVLTMSAKMATATGDLSWEERYRSFEPILDSDIKEISRIPFNADFNETANRVNIANLKLAEMENRAFDLVRAGRKEEGKVILQSKEYEIQKQIYNEGLKEIISTSHVYIEAVYSQQRQRVSIVINSLIASILILIFSWFVVINTFRTYIEQNKKAEATLKESEAKFRILAEQSPNMIFVNKKGRVVYANKKCEEVMGYKQEEFYAPDFNFMVLIAPEYRDMLNATFRKHMEGEDVAPFEYALLTKEGKTIESIITTKVIQYEGETSIIGIITDITQRKQIEQELKKYREHLEELVNERTSELRESEAKYRTLYEGSSDAIMLLDEKGFFDCNNATLRMFGFLKKEDFIKVHPADVSPPYQTDGVDSLTAANKKISEAFRKGMNRFEWMHQRKNGEDFPAEVLLTAFQLNGKEVLQATVRDITERRQAEEARKESEIYLQTIFNSVKTGLLIIDIKTHRILDVNPVAAKLIGLDRNKIIGSICNRFVCPADIGKCPISDLGQKVDNSERVLLTVKGDRIPILKTVVPVTLNGQNILIESFIDITERKHAEGELIKSREHLEELVKDRTTELLKEIDERKRTEEELKKHREQLERMVNERTRDVILAKEEAEHANMAKTNFLHTMSHELRTPLNAVLGFSELLKQKTIGELNEKQERFIDNIITGGNNLHNIIGQILDVVKMYEGTLELRIEKIPVPEIVDEVIGVIKENAGKKNVLIEKNLDPELEYIEADKQKLKQLFINLLDNAVKFTGDEGGTITINVKKEGGMAKFSVSDTGIGIKEEDMEKIFHKFSQVDSGSSRKYGGTGIGLAITKQFVELHGGRIWVESKYGEGSTFTFLIPLVTKKTEIK